MEPLSELNADSGGYCNNVRTSDASQQCGLATTLMEFCFTDENVGSLSSQTIGNIEYPNKIAHLCEHVIYLVCAPDRPYTPTVACSAYLSAAVNADHKVMFTSVNNKGGMNVMNVEKVAKPEFRRNPDSFISKHGASWYFCRCKSETNERCEAIP